MKHIDENGIPYFTSDFDRPESYYEGKTESHLMSYAEMMRFKDQNTALYDKRWQAACEVIDLISSRVGVDADALGLNLYGLDSEGSPLVNRLDDYFDRSGDKVKLKKRIDELENENRVLRSVIGK